MSSSVKGILKGLRYISQIFENEKEEDEIQIGVPTDVKHVAHIGNEGPSTNAPSWMNDLQQGGSESGAESETKSNGKAGATKSSTKDASDTGKTKPKRHTHKSSNGSIGSPAREPSSSNPKPRRNKNNTSVGMDSPSRDIPKSSRPKKSKAGSSGVTNSKTKALNQMTDNFAASPGRGYEMNDSTDMYQKSTS